MGMFLRLMDSRNERYLDEKNEEMRAETAQGEKTADFLHRDQ
jgi:hypothetical protein